MANPDPQQTQTHTHDSKPIPIPVNPPLHHPLQPLPPRFHHHQSPHHHHTINTPPPNQPKPTNPNPNQPSHDPPDLHCSIKTHEPCQSPSPIKIQGPRRSPLLDDLDPLDQPPRPTLLRPRRRTTISTHSAEPMTTPEK